MKEQSDYWLYMACEAERLANEVGQLSYYRDRHLADADRYIRIAEHFERKESEA